MIFSSGPDVVARIVVLCVRRIETDGETKWLAGVIRSVCAQEVDRFVPGDVGQVAHTVIGLSDFIPFFGPVFVVVEHVKHLSHCTLVLQGGDDSVGGYAEFAD